MRPVLLLDVVGLTAAQVSAEHTPRIHALGQRGSIAPMRAILPAVTCSAQATMLTGAMPSEHGAVGNGWRDPHSMDVALWRQSNRLVRGDKVYEAARRRDPGFTCTKLFWWWNMGADVAISRSRRGRTTRPTGARSRPIYGVAEALSGPRPNEAELGRLPVLRLLGAEAPGCPPPGGSPDAAIRHPGDARRADADAGRTSPTSTIRPPAVRARRSLDRAWRRSRSIDRS